jgi:hypothetical protein
MKMMIFRSLFLVVVALLLIVSPGSVVVVEAQNTSDDTTPTASPPTQTAASDITDDDFSNISDDIPQHVTEIAFPPEYTSPCRAVPRTKFTIRTSDAVEVLSYPADLVIVSVANSATGGGDGSVLQIDFVDDSGLESTIDNTTWTGVIIAFPANQLKKVGTIERDQVVHIQDGFTSLTNLSDVNTGGLLTATFTQLLDIEAGGSLIYGLSATEKGKAIVSSTTVGFASLQASTAGAVMVTGDVLQSARADTGGVVMIDGTLYGNGTSTTGSLLLVADVGPEATVAFNTGGQVETPNCTLVQNDNTGGSCSEGNVNVPVDNTTTTELYVNQGYIPCCNWWDLDCGPLAGVVPSSHAVVSSHNTLVLATTSTVMSMMMMMMMMMMSLLCL